MQELPSDPLDAAYWTDEDDEQEERENRPRGNLLLKSDDEAADADEETETKRPRRKPGTASKRPTLTADLLCDPARGLAWLQTQGPRIRYRGRGFEGDDLHKFLKFYEQWAHDLFPRLDFPAFVLKAERVCRERRMKHYLHGLRHGISELSGETMGDVEGNVDFNHQDGDDNLREKGNVETEGGRLVVRDDNDDDDDQPVFKRRVVAAAEQDADSDVSDLELEFAAATNPGSVLNLFGDEENQGRTPSNNSNTAPTKQAEPTIPQKSLEERLEENRVKALELLAKKQREREEEQMQRELERERQQMEREQSLTEEQMDDEMALMDELNEDERPTKNTAQEKKRTRPFWQPFSDDEEDEGLLPVRNILRKSTGGNKTTDPVEERVDDGDANQEMGDLNNHDDVDETDKSAAVAAAMRRKRAVIDDDSD